MTHFASLSVSQFLDALASPEPTPGGGSASAIVGAMGTSLFLMVTSLAKSKTNTDTEKATLAAARTALEPLRATLMTLADADTDAFSAVMDAYRQPKGTDAEKAARAVLIQRALTGATTVPLDTLRVCAAVMDQAMVVAECGNRSASSDVGVAVGLIAAAAAGAAANVRVNLDGLKDESFKAAAAAETNDLMAGVAAGTAAALAHLAS